MLLHKSVEFDSRVRREARTLVAAGHAVTVLELDPDAGGELDGFSRVSVSPPAWVRRTLPFQLYRAVFLGAFLWRLLKLRPDVIHAHDAAMLLPGLLGARLTRASLVYDSHELATGVPYRDGGWAAFVRTIERLAVPRAAAVITVTDGIAERLQSLYRLPARPVVIRNVNDLSPPRKATGILRRRLAIGDAPLVLHQGASAPDRGCEQLIGAVAELDRVHVVFLGSSPFPDYEAHLRRCSASIGVADRVHFLGSVSLSELLDHTVDADIGVSLLQDTCENHRLALPNKVFEYLAVGVPVVTSDLPEIAQLVTRERVGWVVNSGSAQAVAATLRTALASANEDGLREHVLEVGARLSWARESDSLAALYRTLAARNPHPAGPPAATADSTLDEPSAPRA